MAYECNEEDFDVFRRNVSKNGLRFIVKKKRSRRVLMYAGKPMVISKGKTRSEPIPGKKRNKKRDREVLALMSSVKRSFTKFILKHNFAIDIEPDQYKSSYRNTDSWMNLKKGEEFWYVDVNHCFWRIAFLKGYISKTMYQNMLERADMKLYRNMALACVVAPNSCEYWQGEKLLYEIEEANEIYGTMYNNIRRTAYNTIGRIAEAIGDACIGYRIDGIMVTSDYVEVVKTMMEEADFFYKVEDCKKVDADHYTLGDQIRKF